MGLFLSYASCGSNKLISLSLLLYSFSEQSLTELFGILLYLAISQKGSETFQFAIAEIIDLSSFNRSITALITASTINVVGGVSLGSTIPIILKIYGRSFCSECIYVLQCFSLNSCELSKCGRYGTQRNKLIEFVGYCFTVC